VRAELNENVEIPDAAGVSRIGSSLRVEANADHASALVEITLSNCSKAVCFAR
jgi:hypothetical protein